MKKILLFGGVGLALVAITAGVMFFLLGSKAGKTQVMTVTPTPHFELGPTYTMQTRVVNLADPGATRYLKITIVLAFSPTDDKQADVTKKLTDRETVMQDILTTLLSSKTTADLSTPQGKEDLKKAIMQDFGPVLVDLHLTDIYFPEFVMQ